MVVNHGGNLPKAYFVSYLKLIMQAKECSIACAKQEMLNQFFRGNPDSLGSVSHQSFIEASAEIEEN